ncbi:MAG: hypothetical protein ACD_7C00320G0001, partial [uncultured bacterium]
QKDPDYSGMAYRTRYNIDPNHLGITGSLTQGIDLRAFDRMLSTFVKVLIGLAYLTAAALLIRSAYYCLFQKSVPKSITASNEKSTYWQSFKKKAKQIDVKSFWTDAAVSVIALNTL